MQRPASSMWKKKIEQESSLRRFVGINRFNANANAVNRPRRAVTDRWNPNQTSVREPNVMYLVYLRKRPGQMHLVRKRHIECRMVSCFFFLCDHHLGDRMGWGWGGVSEVGIMPNMPLATLHDLHLHLMLRCDPPILQYLRRNLGAPVIFLSFSCHLLSCL